MDEKLTFKTSADNHVEIEQEKDGDGIIVSLCHDDGGIYSTIIIDRAELLGRLAKAS